MKIKRTFDMNVDRYHFDNVGCSIKDDWVQIYTEYDASYYGIWINFSLMKVKIFAEGDIIETLYETQEEFITGIQQIIDFYDSVKFNCYRDSHVQFLSNNGFSDYIIGG